MSFLAGYPQATVYLLYTSALVFACRVPGVVEREGLREAGVRIGWVGAGYALGFGLAAPQIGPTYALTVESVRTAATLADAKIRVLAVDLFWNLRAALAVAGSTNLGLAPLLWAPLALAVRRRRGLVLVLAALALASYVAARGIDPTANAVVAAVPALGWFRCPLRLLLVTQFCLALLTAFGLHALLERTRRARSGAPPDRVRAFATAGASAGIALGWSLAIARAGLPAWSALAAATAPAALALLHPRSRAPALVSIVALLVADLALAPSPVVRMPYFEPSTGAQRIARIASALGEPTGGGRVAFLAAYPSLALKLGALEELRMLEDYEPMTLLRQSQYFTYLQEERLGYAERPGWFTGRSLPFERLDNPRPRRARNQLWRRRRLLDLASVTLLAWETAARLPGGTQPFLRHSGLRPSAIDDEVFEAVENPHALPRALVTYRALPAPPTVELLREISRDDFDPYRASYVEGSPGFGDAAAPRGGPVRIARDEARRVELAVDLEAPGLVVLGDTYASGWRATVDGEPVPILATNHLYRGVRAEAGHHLVRFDYLPLPFVGGVAVAAVSGLLWLALWRGGRQRDVAGSEAASAGSPAAPD